MNDTRKQIVIPKISDINKKYFVVTKVKDDTGIMKNAKVLQISDSVLDSDFELYDDFITVLRRGGFMMRIDPSEDGIDNFDETKNKYEKYKEQYDGKVLTETYYNTFADRLKKIQTKKNSTQTMINFDEIESFDDIDFSTIDMVDTSDDEICPICAQTIPNNDVGITKCGHAFCNSCLQTSFQMNHMCPQCRTSLKQNEIWNYVYDDSTENLDDADANLVNTNGTKMSNLIFLLRKLKGTKTILFSQWDELLVRASKVMNDNGIKNVYCKGTCYERDLAINTFKKDPEAEVIMLSSNSMASGINLTCAQNVIYFDPIYGNIKERGNQEKQATSRGYRIGQTKPFTVYRLMILDSVEHDVYDANVASDRESQSSRPDFMMAHEVKNIYV